MRGFVSALSCCRVPAPKANDSEKPFSKSSQKTAKSPPKRRNDQRILLLGTGESGKSTFLKQMKIIAGKKFKEAELMTFRDIIYDNVYKGVLFLLQVRTSVDTCFAIS
ncbi:unnamed protein product [Dibothriocephalus latus]|uniref:G-protein alpha subunit n=1 Tax=Dibothriocephalus latus TaxID=60516 RepID=A0A3P7L1S4_DIBLA|nr:unnamed protein product [Dibothriocephalus latus]